MATYIALPSLSTGQVVTASYLNQLNDNLRVISDHNHSGSAGEGNSVIISGSSASPHTNRYEVICHIAPSSTNFTGFSTNSMLFGGYQQSGTAIVACAGFPISLFAGSYQLQLMHEMGTAMGIASVLLRETPSVAGSSQGAIDMYAAATSFNNRTMLTVVVPTTGSYVLTIGASGNKNALSSNSTIKFQAFKIKKV